MPPVRTGDRAIATVEPPVVGIVPACTADTAVDVLDPRIADAMRPCVVPAHGHATRGLALNGKQQTVVIGSTATIHSTDVAVEVSRSRCWISQTQPAAFILVCGC